MKKFSTILIGFILSLGLYAQIPQTMSYQAVIRDTEGILVAEKKVGVRVSIIFGRADGIAIYSETQTPTTTKNGLVSLEIGGGEGFDAIDWGMDKYFFRIETDPEGGSNYTITGVSQILSVPYALHAKTAEKLSGDEFPISFDQTTNSLIGNDSEIINEGHNNIFLGKESGLNNISGRDNTFLGFRSGYTNVTGSRNTFIGLYSGFKNIDGYSNTAIGQNALRYNSEGFFNTAVGASALNNNTTGNSNTAVGLNALIMNTEGSSNSAFGYGALQGNTSGNENTAIGHHTLAANTTGTANTALGRVALHWNNTGERNTGLGYAALFSNKSGSRNTAAGIASLQNNESGHQNTAIGDGSLGLNTTGSNNSVVGYRALYENVDGSENTALGNNAGSLLKSGSGNIFIGFQAGANSAFADISNKLIIANSSTSEPLIYGDFARKTIKFNKYIDSPVVYNRLGFWDANSNDHINTYENDFEMPLIYARYFYGEYGDLVIQGQSSIYTGNIHFVTASSRTEADPPTQRMVIMDDGNVGIGNFINPPRARLEVQDGDVYISNPDRGIIMKSPNGNCWRITIDNTGNFVRTNISCPTNRLLAQ